jgi:hypothetical protein
VLVDRVLDAHPWQLLRTPQAALLPDDLDPGAEFNPTSGELRLATLDDWLREDVWPPERDEPSPFRAWARSMLGPVLAT